MDEENKLFSYMLILLGRMIPWEIFMLYAWEIEISNFKIVNMLFIYLWWKFNNSLANVENPILNVFSLYISVGLYIFFFFFFSFFFYLVQYFALLVA